MRVTIKKFSEEVKIGGFFFPKRKTRYFIVWMVMLSEEEKAIVRLVSLEDAILEEFVIPTKYGPFTVTTTIEDVMKGQVRKGFITPMEASNYAVRLKEETIPNLKAYIEGNRPGALVIDTFEL